MPDTRAQSLADSDITVQHPSSFLGRLRFWPRRRHGQDSKNIRVVLNNALLPDNLPSKHHPHRGYSSNRIRTTKYTLLSFIPKNLFEQFHRIANLYFIGIVLLNWVPKINAFGKEIAIIPVVFVLGVTAVKDWFEDYRRYKSDKRINNLTCRVYCRQAGRYVKTLWCDVRVGDVVHLSCNEVVPADMLLLRCSGDGEGTCYLETASLDGESSLKQRQVPRDLYQSNNQDLAFHPSSFQGRIECDPPNHKIYRFNGCVTQPTGEKIPISKENLLLKDCVLKNADFVEGIVVYAGHETKAMLNNGGPRYKRSKLEKLMNRDVVYCIVMLILLCLLGAVGNGVWLSSFDDRTVVPFLSGVFHNEENEVYKDAFYIFWTFVIVLQVMIPLSLYVTVEIIKLGQVYFIHEDAHLYDATSDRRLECRALNITEELGQVEYIFSDKTGTLTENNMIFRRCSVGGVDYDHERTPLAAEVRKGSGDQLYDTPKENSDSKSKGVLVLNPSLQEELSKMEIQLRVDSKSMEITHLNSHSQRIQDFFLLLAVCNTVVVAKHPHKDQMNSSGLFLNTLTPLHLRGAGDPWDTPRTFGASRLLLSEASTPASSGASTPTKRPRTLHLPTHLGYFKSPSPSPLELRPIYEAESPDEIALVETAFAYGCRLLKRSPESVVLSLPGEGLIEFRLLHVLPFDATRKRMSVILQHPITGQKILFCKGADSTVLSQLAPQSSRANKNLIMKTQQHLNGYSRKGLRILCMAKKVISQAEYDAWIPHQRAADICIEDRDKQLYLAACMIEQNLELLGATGIEDRLQEGVPRAIAALREAGIVVWVLTGDKQETAVNIAYSCKLFSTDMEIITLNARSKEAAEDTMRFYLDQIGKDIVTENCSCAPSGSFSSTSLLHRFLPGRCGSTCFDEDKRQRALVIDGRTLAFVLDKPYDHLFLNLAKHCTSVLCCRATPLQKAYIVSLVKESLNVLTLAIGDGANDVSMIQTADVGVGISGKEGMQAVMASDFTLARFRYLERLLLVHGHWCYDRLARTVLYFFYKNATFIFLICWYQWYCGFSGTVMIDQVYLMLYNVLFTSLPPIALGILDKDCPDHILLAKPSLYGQGRRSQVHTKYSFWVNMLDAIYQSIVTFFVPFMAYYDSDTDVWEFGTTICTACVLGQLFHLAIETRSWTYLHVVSLFVSFFIYFGFAVMYNMWPVMSVGRDGLQNPYWVIIHCMGSTRFWGCTVLVPVLACLPRLILRGFQGSLFPSHVTRTLLKHRKSQASSEASTISVTWSKGSSNESSVDIGIHGGDLKPNIIPEKRMSVDSNLTVSESDCAINYTESLRL
ncbi:phospholipid-transporting ATPase VA-like [Uloborus diversus]|uniref:phospholipid-transporting ATPase VA-like n=1 Tax=Uloborus diversus TaxID=327109 RepID=UPI00240A418C|nr:phospholipid-transporting ATPase VA-like [Uloborus diversus]